MNTVNEWARNIFTVIIAVSFIEILMPAGSMEKYLRYIFSIFILASILMPLMQFVS